MREKWLAVGVILLFVGVAIAPCISYTEVKAAPAEEVVAFTTEACGIPGLAPRTVALTRQQACDVDVLFDSIRRNLDTATTVEETVAVFDQAVVDLGSYGLLGGMSVTEAQNLVKRNYLDSSVMDPYQIGDRNRQDLNDSNLLCLIAGETNETQLFSLFEIGCFALSEFFTLLFLLSLIFPVLQIYAIFDCIYYALALGSIYHSINSLRVTGTGVLSFGRFNFYDPYHFYNPAVGWVSTLGVLGRKSWNGSFYGDIFNRPFNFRLSSVVGSFYIGSTGFLGIKIVKSDGTMFYLGSSLRVKINAAVSGNK